MGPIIHVGLTAALISGAKLAGYNAGVEVVVASFVGGVFLDGDKVFEFVDVRKRAKLGVLPDITARCRILHSIFVFPFGLILSLTVFSLLPFIAVLFHIALDSFVPGKIKDGKNYPSHSRRKWLANPFSQKSWAKVIIGWPITYPFKMNWVYNKLAPAIGAALFFLSVFCWILK